MSQTHKRTYSAPQLIDHGRVAHRTLESPIQVIPEKANPMLLTFDSSL